jgi:uncharacterized protein YgfB (UPF0149 family)
MSQTTAYAALSAALADAGFTQSAAEYHGALCGLLCIREPAKVDALAILDGADDAANGAALTALRDATARALADTDGDVRLVLPPDDAVLGARAMALGEWCEGFLFGLASDGRLDLKRAAPEVREVIEDLAQFTRASFDDGSDEEIEEEAYAELVEYVRVGVQLLFMELSPDAQARAAKRQQESNVH